jgi:hypothetical protein
LASLTAAALTTVSPADWSTVVSVEEGAEAIGRPPGSRAVAVAVFEAWRQNGYSGSQS